MAGILGGDGFCTNKQTAIDLSEYWSKELDCKVTFAEPGEPILFVAAHKTKIWQKVIVGEKIGWIMNTSNLIKPLVLDAK